MAETHDQERPPENAAPYRFENPRSIRALAHPARLAIINALVTGDELTATECAELTGLSPSATAYHLKLLERYGIVETAPSRPDRRERPCTYCGRPESPTAATKATIASATTSGTRLGRW